MKTTPNLVIYTFDTIFPKKHSEQWRTEFISLRLVSCLPTKIYWKINFQFNLCVIQKEVLETHLMHSSGWFLQSMLQRYRSHDNHPIGGVRAKPLSRAKTPKFRVATKKISIEVSIIFFPLFGLFWKKNHIKINNLHADTHQNNCVVHSL